MSFTWFFISVIIYDITLTNFANNTVQNKSFGRFFYSPITVFPSNFSHQSYI